MAIHRAEMKFVPLAMRGDGSPHAVLAEGKALDRRDDDVRAVYVGEHDVDGSGVMRHALDVTVGGDTRRIYTDARSHVSCAMLLSDPPQYRYRLDVDPAPITAPVLITEAYRRQLQAHAAAHPEWGSSSATLLDQLPEVRQAVIDADAILDYGCGDGSLVRAMQAVREGPMHGIGGRGVYGYDPRDEEAWPLPLSPLTSTLAFNLIICTDVMEHVEEPCVPAVLADIAGVLYPHDGRLFMSVSTAPALAILPATGELPERNAHITIRPFSWWLERFKEAGLSVASDAVVIPSGFYVWLKGA